MKAKDEQKTHSAEDTKQSKVKTSPSKNQESLKAADLEDKIELERREAYIEPTARELLRKLLENSDEEQILPIYKPNSGFVYTTINEGLANNRADTLTKDFLDNLSRLDILEKIFFESVTVCPNCESTIITMHSRCPKCKSHNVDKTSLTEHIPCGHIDQKNKYNENKCPKCGKPLIEGQYRNMGRWYVCRDCGERFENPELDLICRNCNNNFSLKEAKLIEIPKFSLNKSRKKEIRQNVASLEDINKLLTEMGFSIEIPGLAVGQKSGMQHHFSLIARKLVNQKEIIIALDHAVSESEVQTAPLILYLYKTSEVQVDIPLFVAIPQLNETAKKIAQGHNILLIEGSTEEQKIKENIKNEIKNRLEKIANPINEKLNQQPEGKQSRSILNKIKGINKLKGLRR